MRLRLLGPASPPAAIKARVSGWRAKGGPSVIDGLATLSPLRAAHRYARVTWNLDSLDVFRAGGASAS